MSLGPSGGGHDAPGVAATAGGCGAVPAFAVDAASAAGGTGAVPAALPGGDIMSAGGGGGIRIASSAGAGVVLAVSVGDGDPASGACRGGSAAAVFSDGDVG
ncbi:MAG TPA: hypothetical protein VFK49_03160, partial [Stellaceae bacterium]|nr:hypothetical protein [Stellaceae bacterium]